MGKKTALLVVLTSVVVVGLFTTSQAFIASNIHMCPHSLANDTQDAFGLSNRSAYVQLGQTHRIPCLPYSQREGESPFIVWYKLNESTNIGEKGKERLVSYNRKEIPGKHGPRYSLAYDFGLLIKDVEESDGGKYMCEVIWRDTEYIKQEETINIQVIGHTFPHGSEAVGEESPPSRLEQGRRHTLQCGCASQTPDTWDSVVYWSMGEGITTDTQIIGARFSDGTTLQIQHGADYSIGSDTSLTINSLNDLQDTQRFWCHVFQSNGTLRRCSTDVQILQDQNSSFVPIASSKEFYLSEGHPQVLPCRSWTPGDVMCEVRWIHEPSQRVVFSYNLSTDTVEADSDYDLASDFGLLIKSVNHIHGGRYTCNILDGLGNTLLKGAIDTYVIGKPVVSDVCAPLPSPLPQKSAFNISRLESPKEAVRALLI
ncbi:uncharacterized protein LOC119725473 [Patiria miniata]|uniref:Ig-like domain-containing protein n=1 Tax=Patiria miniata TaxID=46514 RepID=A0A913ZP44_PATMI|nr:uncharacterized protein LOC119725473 [Patiria miniata]